MKKIIAGIALIILCVFLFTGCDEFQGIFNQTASEREEKSNKNTEFLTEDTYRIQETGTQAEDIKEELTTVDPEYYSPGLEFTLNDSKDGYFVSFGKCTDTEVIIPSIYKGKPVTEIGTKAFNWCSSLISITIPDSVTSIGSYAFQACSNLTSIIIPDSVTSISRVAFEDCSSLTSITIPDSVTSIGDHAFHSCSSLTSITYKGTKAEWNRISKGLDWNMDTGEYIVHCTDGDIAKQ